MKNDIVEQLRSFVNTPGTSSAFLANAVIIEAADTIERLRKERDEARRAWLMFMFIYEDGIDMDPNGRVPYRAELDEAELRGWDCFKEKE